MDERTERLNRTDSTLHLVFTPRRKGKNGSMGALRGAGMVLGGTSSLPAHGFMTTFFGFCYFYDS